MLHTMRLAPSPFEKIKSGRKTIELRLYDEKRRGIRRGDLISFTSTACETDSITVRVEDLYIFDSFEALYKALPLTECGYAPGETDGASPEDMKAYYSEEEQKRYGAVGIRIALV